MKKSIRMHKADNVATLLEDANENDCVGVYDEHNQLLYKVTAGCRVPFGNKVALENISCGGSVMKYGGIIGKAVRDIPKGDLVHVHNVRSQKVDIPMASKIEIMRQLGYDMEGRKL